ncbi:hypothetical protein CH330_06755 [candidate division WOR-3 bacterium JGI_Cruoil_03_51_56]|uniref:Gingipain domain-containing protein n=1 Tax=candidate division WOR-3 bacterium JGI_Cruoil_03_51_56 TaxID=1973747 RepID=A0A235BSA3_UNCW3|nr:MAG: hypothetical protein CH330_06755 [candidate division WOR-3 bacterium JGI_Cruoil_03_51_56]
MKRLLVLLVTMSLTLMAGTITRTAEFEREGLVFSSDHGYDIINLKGCPAVGHPGEPLLPEVIQSLVIPAGAVVTGVELLAEEWVELPGTYKVGPAQPDVILPRPGVDYTPTPVAPDPEVYGSTASYPDATLQLLTSGTMCGYRLANVRLNPVRYTPSTGRLQLATRLEYRLTYVVRDQAWVATRKQQEAFGTVVQALVVNPQDVSRFAPRVRRNTVSALPPGNYEYVAITRTPLDTVFQRLADWKTLKGTPGTVVLIPWIESNYPGYDTQEKIRNFIIDAHQTWGTMYVLLGGQGDYSNSGQNIFPTRMGNCGSGGDEPCDLYYAGLDGNWDANGNHVYGQLDDSTDMYSDVYVGRAPVYTVTMAQNFVHKVIIYEQNPPVGFIKKMLLPTGILWSSYEERAMVESIARQTPAGWSDGKLYERAGALSEQAVMDSLNAGSGMSHWDGHGNPSGIYMNGGSTPFFRSSNADALVNGDRTGIAVSISCDCAAWDHVSGGDCLAEHMVNRVGGGFIASIMNTRHGYGAIGPGGNYVPGPSERLDTTFYAGVLLYNMPHTGQALGYSKACWAPYADSLYQYRMQRYCIYDLNLLGDPETSLWTEEPESLNVAHAGVVTIGNNVPYPVTVTTPSTAPVESALVVLRKPNEVDVRGRTNSSGQVTLLVSALTPGPMAMAVNAHDHYVFIDTVQVIASERYVSYLRSSIYDPGPGGNGDSILNPGETVKIPTWVKNWGQQTAYSVTATLRTHDANAQVTDSVKTFGTIAAGDSAYTGLTGFGLHVNSGLTNGYAVACSLICRDANDSVWVSNIQFLVGTAVLEERTVTVIDTAHGGNGNGRLDPDETADLAINIRNTGMGHGYNCRGVFRSADARLQVVDSAASYGLVRKGDSASSGTDFFTVHADAGIPPETPISCTLHLYADGGYSVLRPLTVVVGEFRTIDPIPDGPRLPALYYAYDDVDTGYAQHPEFEWVEIHSQGTRLNYSQNDDVLVVNLPTGFGPLKYYGQRYTQVSVSADGWIAAGSCTTSNYSNTSLPSASAPPAVVALNWDDLYPGYSSRGYVYYYHDAANHQFVIEFDSVCYYANRSLKDKYELVIYDTTMAAPDGHNELLCQYLTANGYSSSTFGIQDPTRTIGIQCLYNGDYHRGCATIEPGRAIKYSTREPVTGVTGKTVGPAGVGRARFAVWPNPVHGLAQVRFSLARPADVRLAVFDRTGRKVRSLLNARMKLGDYCVTWDGRDEVGRKLSQGVYFVQLAVAGDTYRQKLVVTK